MEHNLPTWLHIEEELQKIAEHGDEPCEAFFVYRAINYALTRIFADKRIFKVVHGFDGKPKNGQYVVAWVVNEKLFKVYLDVIAFDETNIEFLFYTELEKKMGKSNKIKIPKNFLYDWLNAFVDEIFIQAI